MGAALAAGIILAHIEFYGVIAVAPAFYELIATLYFGALGRNTERKLACRNPVIDAQGRLYAPTDAKNFTLAYVLISRKPLCERTLVHMLMGIYAVAGVAAVGLSLLG